MTEVVKLNAEIREGSGKGVVRSLKRNGKIPGIIYSDRHEASTMIVLPFIKFNTEFQKGGLKSKLVELTLNGKAITAIAKDIQIHPVTDRPEHVDFKKVDRDTVIRVFVPVKIINEDKAPGVKKGGVVNLVHRNIEVVCHPTNIPQSITIDVFGMEIGANKHMYDIKLPEGVASVDKTNFTVISIVGRMEEKEETTAAALGAVPAAGSPAAAGTAPAAGAAAPATGVQPAAPVKGKK